MEEACWEKKKGGRSLSNPPCTGSGPLLHGRGLLGEEEGGKTSIEPTLHRERPTTTWKRPVGRRRGEEVYRTHLAQGAAHYYMEEACWEKKKGGRSLSNPPCTGSGPLLHGRGLLGEEEGGKKSIEPTLHRERPTTTWKRPVGRRRRGEEVYRTHLAQGAAHYYMEEACREKKKGGRSLSNPPCTGSAHYYMEEACREKKGGRSLSNPPCTGSGPLLQGRGL